MRKIFPPSQRLSNCSPKSETTVVLQNLLAALRGAHWSHWTSHWQTIGPEFYGDHLLLQRLYEAIPLEIDNLAEKLVGYYGADAVEPICQAHIMIEFLKFQEEKDPLVRALHVEEFLLAFFNDVFKLLESQNELSLGMNDFLAGIANSHETFVYLLRQRTR